MRSQLLATCFVGILAGPPPGVSAYLAIGSHPPVITPTPSSVTKGLTNWYCGVQHLVGDALPTYGLPAQNTKYMVCLGFNSDYTRMLYATTPNHFFDGLDGTLDVTFDEVMAAGQNRLVPYDVTVLKRDGFVSVTPSDDTNNITRIVAQPWGDYAPENDGRVYDMLLDGTTDCIHGDESTLFQVNYNNTVWAQPDIYLYKFRVSGICRVKHAVTVLSSCEETKQLYRESRCCP